MLNKAQHIVCLMLENRSFDHMLGYLDHGDNRFEGLTGKTFTDDGIPASDNAGFHIPVGPDHSHLAVMQQLVNKVHPDKPYTRTGTGFVANFRNRVAKSKAKNTDPGRVMRCFHPAMLPVLSTLAKEYAVCDHWFSSVPGGTYPNRDFAYAGTSLGYGENPDSLLGLIKLRKKHGKTKTIFEHLTDTSLKRSYRIYYHDLPTLWLYPQFVGLSGRGRSRKFDKLLQDIQNDNLADFSFVEPDYGVTGMDFGKTGNSQHPNQAARGKEFVAGEHLIADVYNAFARNPKVFEKTVLIVTYDEHGGFYDHVMPPAALQPDNHEINDGTYKFRFDLLGARVPTVIISPWIKRGTLDQNVYDHTSIPATVLKAFDPNADVLGERVKHARTFLDLLTLTSPRRSTEIPLVRALEQDHERVEMERKFAGTTEDAVEGNTIAEHNELADGLLQMAHAVNLQLDGADALDDELPNGTPDMGGDTQSYINAIAKRVEQQGENLIELRDAQGRTYTDPTKDQMGKLMAELAHNGPGAEIRLSDTAGRRISVDNLGRVVFHTADGALPLHKSDSSDMARLALEIFAARDLNTLRGRFA